MEALIGKEEEECDGRRREEECDGRSKEEECDGKSREEECDGRSREEEEGDGKSREEECDGKSKEEECDGKSKEEEEGDGKSREEECDGGSKEEECDGKSREEECDGKSREEEGDGGVVSDAPPEFRYEFDGEGRLVHRDTRARFLFSLRRSDGSLRGAEEHEALLRYITRHVHRVLEERCLLLPAAPPAAPPAPPAPPAAPPTAPPAPPALLLSPEALSSDRTLLVLVPDRGAVRSGQWSWQAIARDGLETGSQLPYVQRAQREGWGVALLDPNAAGEASPEEHLRHAWDRLLAGAAASQVAVVAHGYGGLAFVDLLTRRPQELQRRVSAVAFIDSAHNLWHQPLGGAARDWLRAHSRKWVLSSKPLNRPMASLQAGGPHLSAGTLDRRAAPASCLDAVFRYFAKALRGKPAPGPAPMGMVTRSQKRA